MVQSLKADVSVERNTAPRYFLRQLRGIALLGLVGMLLWRLLPSHAHQVVPTTATDPSGHAQAVAVILQAVVPTTSLQSVEVTGTVQSELESPIASKVMARVQSVLIREGESVRRGQTLLRLDARDLDASVAQAHANLRSATIGYKSARVAAHMEEALSRARIAEAQAKAAESQAALQAATAKLELVQAGPRHQEREQAVLGVAQAQANFTLATSNLKRMANLFEEGAIAAQQYDEVRAQYEVARSQYETAQQSKSLVDEGSRTEEIRAAQQAVQQAQASVQEANAGLKSAQASALQTEVRTQEIYGAQAQINQSQASLQLAQVSRDYATLVAPFDGVVTRRLADPGAMATPGSVLLTLQGGERRLEAVVPETILAFVHKGDAVPVHFDALPGPEVTGRVIEVAPQGDTSSHTFVVKIALPHGIGAPSGMFGRVRFTTGTTTRLTVPAFALQEREGLHYLYVVDSAHVAHLRMVTLGNPDGRRVPILSGLNVGERIVMEGKERLMDGSPVTESTR